MTETISTTTRIGVTRLAGNIGAEISGIDTAGLPSDDAVAQIRQALLDHKVVFLRDQSLDYARQVAFAERLGPLTLGHPTLASPQDQPFLEEIDSHKGGRANHWHTDVTFVLNPPQASTLRSIVVPPYGGETLIANAGAAYRNLPGPLRAFADTLRAVHTNDYDYAVPPESLNETQRERRKIFIATKYETAHPVVRVHPLTGERGLFIGGFAQRIVGLSKGESYELLKILQQYVTRPENILRVTWEPGQLVLFDNRITQHYAIGNYDAAPRRLHRVTVAGDVPVGIDGQPSVAVAGDASRYTAVAS